MRPVLGVPLCVHESLCGRAGQGSIAPPACVGATPVDGPIDVEEGLPVEMPLVYFSGNVSPDPNPQLYRHHVECMAALLDKRAQANPQVGPTSQLHLLRALIE